MLALGKLLNIVKFGDSSVLVELGQDMYNKINAHQLQ